MRTQEHYKSLGEHVQAVKLDHMRIQLQQFKTTLEQFAIDHRRGRYRLQDSPASGSGNHTEGCAWVCQPRLAALTKSLSL